MIPDTIRLVQQKDDTSCTVACLAMVTGISQDDIVKIIQNDIVDHSAFERFLIRNFIRPDYVLGYAITQGSVYIVDVPSLSQKAALHKIVLDFRGMVVKAYDPETGRPGRESYTELWDRGELDRIPFGNAIKLTDFGVPNDNKRVYS